jgi:hypothetical protein
LDHPSGGLFFAQCAGLETEDRREYLERKSARTPI